MKGGVAAIAAPICASCAPVGVALPELFSQSTEPPADSSPQSVLVSLRKSLETPVPESTPPFVRICPLIVWRSTPARWHPKVVQMNFRKLLQARCPSAGCTDWAISTSDQILWKMDSRARWDWTACSLATRHVRRRASERFLPKIAFWRKFSAVSLVSTGIVRLSVVISVCARAAGASHSLQRDPGGLPPAGQGRRARQGRLRRHYLCAR
jgi:hypothetical protein